MSAFNTIRQSTALFIQHGNKVATRQNASPTLSSAIQSLALQRKPQTIYQNELIRVEKQQRDVNQLITSIQNNLKKKIVVVDVPVIGKIGEKTESLVDVGSLVGYEAMNRNKRKPKKANHGKRPCSRIARRAKRSKSGNPRR
jgi:hypothetical protein|eukprot:306285_1